LAAPQSHDRSIESFASTDQERHRLLAFGMSKVQSHRRQEHAINARSLVEHLVPSMISMAMITDDWMAKMVQVSSDLMPTPRLWPNL
jgi:hypothetical protein